MRRVETGRQSIDLLNDTKVVLHGGVKDKISFPGLVFLRNPVLIFHRQR